MISINDHFQFLGPLPRHINSPSYDIAAYYLAEKYNLKVTRLTEEDEVNGWVIPPKYSLISGYIKDINNAIILDASNHPLSVISYSSAIDKLVSREELLSHCHYDHRCNDNIPYHFRQSYRPWSRDWGFCMTKTLYDNLTDDSYHVSINVTNGPKELLIVEADSNPSSQITFVLAAHLDHPGMVNDDLTGVITICEAFKRLSSASVFNVKLVLLPEIIGAELYLQKQDAFTDGIFVESVGIDTGKFYLQKPKVLCSQVPNICKTLNKYNIEIVPSRFFFGNDECIFESFGCPMSEINRGYFSEYHSDKDNASLIDINSIHETIDLIVDIVTKFQQKTFYKKNFKGTVCCSNPMYNLYKEPGQPVFGEESLAHELRPVMDAIPLLPSIFSLEDILAGTNCDYDFTKKYLDQWCNLGLITLLS